MMYKEIRTFKSHELLFSKDETVRILKFIFKPSEYEAIDSLEITVRVRNFAQGLLIEAIDASYAMGFVHALFKASANPTSGIVSLLKKFGKDAASHWFKHVQASDLQNIKVYQHILDSIALKSKRFLHIMLVQVEDDSPLRVAAIHNAPSGNYVKVWG
ncbi:MAG: hypothetical protein COA76_14900 [Moritella sp.]|uniref:hypothetical protein n=1 Tax=unclassified Moritella TaxID=2637987 RepID=UPI00015688BF|nr:MULTISPECIES: hypothetical protein [unclassified Moritella]EDM68163.1 hypothetical protein PE36_20819 [Moritella sp. PE36]MBL1417045.1 hypothetical protein [Moritella sp.]PHR86564.1 MAG: hypothetical protein COA76_14900 [Moritella sp.]